MPYDNVLIDALSAWFVFFAIWGAVKAIALLFKKIFRSKNATTKS